MTTIGIQNPKLIVTNDYQQSKMEFFKLKTYLYKCILLCMWVIKQRYAFLLCHPLEAWLQIEFQFKSSDEAVKQSNDIKNFS